MKKILILTAAMFVLAACTTTSEPSATSTGDATATAPAPFSSDRISVEVVGSGKDVILIPGLSSSPEVWQSTVQAVPGYRYHLVHVKGFAGAAPGANANGPFLDPVAHAISEYIAANKLEAPALVGHSLGGSIAMRLATHHPEQVGKLMVVDMLPFMGVMFGGPTATADSVKPAAEASRKNLTTLAGDARRDAITKTIGNMVKTEGLRAKAVEHSMTSDPAVSGNAMYDLITTDMRADLANYKGPIEVLWVYPPNAPIPEAVYGPAFTQSFKAAPQAQVKQVPDAWHFLMWDNPTFWQAELKAFLEK